MYFSIPLSSHNKAITDVAISRRWSHPIVSLSRHDIKTNFGSHVIKMGVSARCETGGCGSSPSLDPRLAGILVRIVATRQRPFAPDSFLHCVRITQYPPHGCRYYAIIVSVAVTTWLRVILSLILFI